MIYQIIEVKELISHYMKMIHEVVYLEVHIARSAQRGLLVHKHQEMLQRDIISLHRRSEVNKMKFPPNNVKF